MEASEQLCIMEIYRVISVSFVVMSCWTNCESELGKRFGDSGASLDVEVVQGFPSGREFFTYFALQSRPLKMAGAAKFSPAFDKWEDSYFLSLQESSEAFVNVETRKKENRTQPTIEMPFQEFVEVYKDTDQYMVDPVPEFLRNDVIVPGPLQCPQVAENFLVENIMWFSSGGTKSVVHTDAVDNILCLFRGEKTFVMVDPDKYMDKVDIDHPEGAYSDIDVDSVDYDRYPGLVGIEFYHVNISSGDCLFIPYKWIHQVRSYNRNLAVNIWWDHHRNSEIDVESCPTDMDPNFTLDKVNFVSFAELMSTISSIRDQFYEFSIRTKTLTFDKFVELLVANNNLDDAGEGFKVPLRQMFKLIDANRDGVLHKNEVLTTSDEDWEDIKEHMQRFEAILAAIEPQMDGEENDDDENFHEEL